MSSWTRKVHGREKFMEEKRSWKRTVHGREKFMKEKVANFKLLYKGCFAALELVLNLTSLLSLP